MGRTHANRSARIVGHGGGTPPSPPANPVTITTVTPASGATNVAVTVSPKATFNLAMNASTIITTTVKLNNGAVAGAVTYNANNKRAIFNPTASLAEGTTYAMKVVGGGSGVKSGAGGQMTADYTWSFTTAGSITPPPDPPPGLVIVGYADLAGVTGGGDTVTHTVNSAAPDAWQQFSDAARASGTRHIRITGSTHINGGGGVCKVTTPNLTVDGTDWSGSFRRAVLQLKSNNWILTQLRLRPGDNVSSVGDADALTVNPGVGGLMSRGVIDHCSISWGPDVSLAVLNRVEDLTVQHSIIGPGLYTSDFPQTPHSYGSNITVPGNGNPASEYGRRMTFYRCLWIHNWGRNFKFEQVDGLEAVNCVVYNWGKELGHGNPRGVNVVGNMFKKGPDTRASDECWEPDPNYGQFAASTYLPESGADRNIGLGFTPTYNISGAARRASEYGGGLHNVTCATPDATLAATVVAAAGPTVTDAVDQVFKDNFTNGDGSFWYGQGHGSPAVPY